MGIDTSALVKTLNKTCRNTLEAAAGLTVSKIELQRRTRALAAQADRGERLRHQPPAASVRDQCREPPARPV